MTSLEKKIVRESLIRVGPHSSRQVAEDHGVLVAMGDSWFDLEKYFFDFGKHVLDQLEDFGYDVKSVADEGDTMESMAYYGGQFKKLTKKLSKLNKKGEKPRAILISGGGNDITDNLEVMLNHRRSGGDILNNCVVEGVINVGLRNAYETLLKLIDGICNRTFGPNSRIPMLVHGYAYAVPDGRSVLSGVVNVGPWLMPVFEKKGYRDLQQNTETVRCVIDRFNTMLDELCEKQQFSHVRYVDVRDSLRNDLNTYKEDWDDELHPSL